MADTTDPNDPRETIAPARRGEANLVLWPYGTANERWHFRETSLGAFACDAELTFDVVTRSGQQHVERPHSDAMLRCAPWCEDCRRALMRWFGTGEAEVEFTHRDLKPENPKTEITWVPAPAPARVIENAPAGAPKSVAERLRCRCTYEMGDSRCSQHPTCNNCGHELDDLRDQIVDDTVDVMAKESTLKEAIATLRVVLDKDPTRAVRAGEILEALGYPRSEVCPLEDVMRRMKPLLAAIGFTSAGPGDIDRVAALAADNIKLWQDEADRLLLALRKLDTEPVSSRQEDWSETTERIASELTSLRQEVETLRAAAPPWPIGSARRQNRMLRAALRAMLDEMSTE